MIAGDGEETRRCLVPVFRETTEQDIKMCKMPPLSDHSKGTRFRGMFLRKLPRRASSHFLHEISYPRTQEEQATGEDQKQNEACGDLAADVPVG
jgi:hypothetical protein